ncbi:hypothetical protein D3C73_1176260 [compost metagenome]
MDETVASEGLIVISLERLLTPEVNCSSNEAGFISQPFAPTAFTRNDCDRACPFFWNARFTLTDFAFWVNARGLELFAVSCGRMTTGL